MSFKKDIENYQAFSEKNYIFHSDPEVSFWSEFKGFSLRLINMDETHSFKKILDDWASIIPCEPSTNWGYDFLVRDLDEFIFAIHRKVKAGKFNVLMDCLTALIGGDAEALAEVNEFLNEHNIVLNYF